MALNAKIDSNKPILKIKETLNQMSKVSKTPQEPTCLQQLKKSGFVTVPARSTNPPDHLLTALSPLQL